MPSRVFDIFQELFELIQDTPRTRKILEVFVLNTIAYVNNLMT